MDLLCIGCEVDRQVRIGLAVTFALDVFFCGHVPDFRFTSVEPSINDYHAGVIGVRNTLVRIKPHIKSRTLNGGT